MDLTRGTAVRTTHLTSEAGVAWQVTARDTVPEDAASAAGPLSATVPGEVHLDLLAAGVIPDPYDGDNEARLSWIGRTGWSYRCTFVVTGLDTFPHHDLVADGLDTVAEIVLNGTVVGRTANQHRGHRFDVGPVLRNGENELVVNFDGPVPAAAAAERVLGPYPHVNHHPFNAIRKMACAYGWDWGIDAAGVGIWRDLRIESWGEVRLDVVRPLPHLDGSTGVLDVVVGLVWAAGATSPATVTLTADDRTSEVEVTPGTREITVSVEIPEVELWWPRGYGDQPLYEIGVDLVAGPMRQRCAARVGFRTVAVITEPDADGTPFRIEVNGRTVHVKGANWIPDSAFVTTVTAEQCHRSITDAVEAGMNLLRVWGGGIYESDDFYDSCDELGILVWQDFLFACAAYSEDEPLRSEVEVEARQAVARLNHHASLVLWNGCNENIWGHADWGWRDELGDRPWGSGYYRDLLPQVVAELAPYTPYSPGSPYSYDDARHPNDERHGTMHIWDVWNRADFREYANKRPRFVSEFGFQGPPAWSTLTSVVHDEPLDPYGVQMLVHQKAEDGNGKLERGLGDHLPVPSGIDDWHWATQLNQARAIAFGIEHFRSRWPDNTGSVVWQLNDSWPVISWAAVDAHGIRKPLWYALRRVFADRLTTVRLHDDEPAVVLHNDSDEPWTTTLSVRRRTTTGDVVLGEQTVEVTVAARTVSCVALSPEVAVPRDPGSEFVSVATRGATTSFAYWVEDPELRLASTDEAGEVTARRTDGGYRVTVMARSLLKDVALFPDRLDAAARVDSCLVSLQPGEQHTFVVTSGDLDESALIRSPVLRSVADLTS